MAQKIVNFIASRSEQSRRIMAGFVVSLTGIGLFFAWAAGVSARLPLLGNQLDGDTTPMESNTIPSSDASNTQRTDAGNASTLSPLQGLMQSFRDLERLFNGAPVGSSDARATSASSTPDRPLDDLFDKMGDATSSTPAEDQETPPAMNDNQPPADELPGL